MDLEYITDRRIEELVNSHIEKEEWNQYNQPLTKDNYTDMLSNLTGEITEGIEEVYREEYNSLPRVNHIIDTRYMGHIVIKYKISHQHELRSHMEFDLTIPVYNLDLFQYLGWKNAGL